jgi:hypothetical protein
VLGGIKHLGTYLDAIWLSWSYFAFSETVLEMLIMAMGPILVPIVEFVSGAPDLDLARLLRP